MKYRFIAAEKATYGVDRLCRVLGVARSGYYAWRRCPQSVRAQHNAVLLTQIHQVHLTSRGRYGSPRIYQELRDRGAAVGRHRVARLMRQHGLRSVGRRARPRRSAPASPAVVAANTLQRDFTATGPNQKWAGDLTYIRTGEGWLYLAVLMDLYSRRIVGWAMGEQPSTMLTVTALDMALQHRPSTPGLVHHSDRGIQYVAAPYQARLQAAGVQCSMSRPGNCWDNAAVESFFATLKTECLPGPPPVTRRTAHAAIFEYIEAFYNRTRRHSTLGYLSPVEFERRAGQSTTVSTKSG